MEEETGAASAGDFVRLEEMPGWLFDWEAISTILQHYESSLYWLAIAIIAIFVLFTQLVFFPLFYRGLKIQAPSSMRLAYLMSLMLAFIVFHWWLWHFIFIALTRNYWMWLVWGISILLWAGLVFWTPRKKIES